LKKQEKGGKNAKITFAVESKEQKLTTANFLEVAAVE
jgi:hypothetical protein